MVLRNSQHSNGTNVGILSTPDPPAHTVGSGSARLVTHVQEFLRAVSDLYCASGINILRAALQYIRWYQNTYIHDNYYTIPVYDNCLCGACSSLPQLHLPSLDEVDVYVPDPYYCPCFMTTPSTDHWCCSQHYQRKSWRVKRSLMNGQISLLLFVK